MREEDKLECLVCAKYMEPIIKDSKDFYQCPACKHTFINYTGNGLDYHKEDYRNNGCGTRTNDEIVDGKFTNDFHKARKEICQNRFEFIKEYIKGRSTLLDIGAGGGTFASMLKDRTGLKIDCQEISDVCYSNLVNYGFNSHHGDFCSIDFGKQFDIVTCWHVLEHIKDLSSFSNKAAEVCSDLLIVEVPINRKLRDPNEGWDGHYHYFSEASLSELFKNNFYLIDTKEGVQSPAIFAVFQRC